MSWPDPEGNTLQDVQDAWDAQPDDGECCDVGDKPPRPVLDDHVPTGMTLQELNGQADPKLPNPLVDV